MKGIKITALVFSVFCIVFGGGCHYDGDPANISLSVLQLKMHKAMDPTDVTVNQNLMFRNRY